VFAISEQAESFATKLRARVAHAMMSHEMIHTAMSTWAAKDLPARLLSAQVAKLLNCTTDDVAILVSAGKSSRKPPTRLVEQKQLGPSRGNSCSNFFAEENWKITSIESVRVAT